MMNLSMTKEIAAMKAKFMIAVAQKVGCTHSDEPGMASHAVPGEHAFV